MSRKVIVPFTRTSGAFAAAPGDSARMSAMREISGASAQAAGIRANNAEAMAMPEKSQRQSMAQPAELRDAGKALLPVWGSKWEDIGNEPGKPPDLQSPDAPRDFMSIEAREIFFKKVPQF